MKKQISMTLAVIIFAASLSACTKPVIATTTEDETEETTVDDCGIMMYVYVGDEAHIDDYVFIGITVPK
jgi:hypothetical protein